jgi:L-lactate dehydrogenase complex protein LldE
MSKTVQLFITCILDTLYPEVGIDVVQILNRAGVKVNFPVEQTCCGQPAYNAGMRAEAKRVAKQTIRVFEKTDGEIIIPSGSCCGMIRHHYPELFADEPKWEFRAKALSERVFELTEYLVDVLQIVDLGAFFPHTIAYHASCHLLRELGVNSQPRELLKHVHGAQLVELPEAEDCCGFGGVFSVEHPQLSDALLSRKIENILRSGAEVVTACDAGCITNINGGLVRRNLHPKAVHLASILNHYQATPSKD